MASKETQTMELMPSGPARRVWPVLISAGALLLASVLHFRGFVGYRWADTVLGAGDLLVGIGLFRRTEWARKGYVLLCCIYLAGMVAMAAYTAEINGTFAFGIPDHTSDLGRLLGFAWTAMSFFI